MHLLTAMVCVSHQCPTRGEWSTIIIKIKASKNKIEQKALEYRNFSLQNITNFKLMLQNENWQEVLNSSDTQSAYNAFHDKFLQLYELFFC